MVLGVEDISVVRGREGGREVSSIGDKREEGKLVVDGDVFEIE